MKEIQCLKLVFCRVCGKNQASEDIQFCPSCGTATDGSANIKPNAKISQQNESEKIEYKSKKTRPGGTGKIIGGVFLILIGLGIAGYGLWLYNHQTTNIQECNTILGQLGQIDPQNETVCKNAPENLIIGAISGIMGVILLIIGLILIAFGIKQKSK